MDVIPPHLVKAVIVAHLHPQVIFLFRILVTEAVCPLSLFSQILGETLDVRHTSQGCHSVVVVNLIPSALHQQSTVTLVDRQTLSANLIMKIG